LLRKKGELKLSDDWLKSMPARPEGSLKSKPTWEKRQEVVFPRRLFFGLVASAREGVELQPRVRVEHVYLFERRT
jgi:hypothetical protein